MPGTIRQRSKGSWEVCCYLGETDAKGRYKRITRTVRGTKKQAEQVLAQLVAETSQGTYTPPSREALGAFLERWLGTLNAAPRTRQTYTSIVRQRWTPALGGVRLDRLRPEQIAAAEHQWLGEGLSSSTVLLFHAVLQRALKQAVAWDLLAASPMARVHRPRPSAFEPVILDRDQLRRFRTAIETHHYRIPYLLMVVGGLRAGEVLGLRWQDVDLERGVVRLVQQYHVQLKTFARVKSARSRRPIDLPESLIATLRAHRQQQAETRRLAEPFGTVDHDLVCSRDDGRPLTYNTVYRCFKRLLRVHGLPLATRPHDLRHAMATHMLADGAPLHAVQERLGHASAAFTLERYGHVLPGSQRQAAETFAAMLAGIPADNANGEVVE